MIPESRRLIPQWALRVKIPAQHGGAVLGAQLHEGGLEVPICVISRTIGRAVNRKYVKSLIIRKHQFGSDYFH